MRSTIGLAAGIVLVVGIAWFFAVSSSSPAWAEVAARLATVRNVSFWLCERVSTANGTEIRGWWREYCQDPGLIRREEFVRPNARVSERYFPKPSDPASLPPVESYSLWRLVGNEQHYYNVRLKGPGTLLSAASHDIIVGDPNVITDPVSRLWNRLQDIQASAVHAAGREWIEGKPTAVFEATGVEKYLWHLPDTRAKVRLWVDENTHLPIRMQITGKDGHGHITEQTMENVQWNVDLPSDFFSLPADVSIRERARHFYLPPGTRFKPNVTFRLQARNGTEILNQDQIESVESVLVALETKSIYMIRLGLPKELIQRWPEIWPQTEGRSLRWSLNDRQGSVSCNKDAFPQDMFLKLPGITYEQFAAEYLEFPKKAKQ